jgi:hypothetical protein
MRKVAFLAALLALAVGSWAFRPKALLYSAHLLLSFKYIAENLPTRKNREQISRLIIRDYQAAYLLPAPGKSGFYPVCQDLKLHFSPLLKRLNARNIRARDE